MRIHRRERRPSPEELRLWRGVVRDARPLRELPEIPAEEPVARVSVPEPPVPDASPARERFVTPMAPVQRGLALDPERPSGLDRRNWQRLKRGQLPLEGLLDLHGATQEAAHQRLGLFLASVQSQGRRCVLIVTGKGRSGDGVLRHMVPRWLNEAGNRERVVAYCPAQLRHGGSGALYVLVRRPRGSDRR